MPGTKSSSYTKEDIETALTLINSLGDISSIIQNISFEDELQNISYEDVFQNISSEDEQASIILSSLSSSNISQIDEESDEIENLTPLSSVNFKLDNTNNFISNLRSIYQAELAKSKKISVTDNILKIINSDIKLDLTINLENNKRPIDIICDYFISNNFTDYYKSTRKGITIRGSSMEISSLILHFIVQNNLFIPLRDNLNDEELSQIDLLTTPNMYYKMNKDEKKRFSIYNSAMNYFVDSFGLSASRHITLIKRLSSYIEASYMNDVKIKSYSAGGGKTSQTILREDFFRKTYSIEYIHRNNQSTKKSDKKTKSNIIQKVSSPENRSIKRTKRKIKISRKGFFSHKTKSAMIPTIVGEFRIWFEDDNFKDLLRKSINTELSDQKSTKYSSLIQMLFQDDYQDLTTKECRKILILLWNYMTFIQSNYLDIKLQIPIFHHKTSETLYNYLLQVYGEDTSDLETINSHSSFLLPRSGAISTLEELDIYRQFLTDYQSLSAEEEDIISSLNS